MLISTIENRNFETPFRNPSNRTKKIWFHVWSVTAKMFELQNSGENLRIRSEILFEDLPRAYKDLI